MSIGQLQEQKTENTIEIRNYFISYLRKVNYKGIFGVAKFSAVYKELMPVQQDKLKNILKQQLEDYIKIGSIISLGIFYPPDIIDCINVNINGKLDKDLWNRYSDEYQHLNDKLKYISRKIAKKFKLFAFPPTTGVPAENIRNVIDYYPHTISHRVVAEHAGIGWRGKSELIITKTHGPAVRFTSILCNLPLIQGEKIENMCGECTACLKVCPILKNKDKLEDYREDCREFLISLGLKHDICGKCIKACYRDSIFKDKFKSEPLQYTNKQI
jgi:epoxyqueuosine reductase